MTIGNLTVTCSTVPLYLSSVSTVLNHCTIFTFQRYFDAGYFELVRTAAYFSSFFCTLLCSGVFKKLVIDYCRCERKAAILVRLGFWPLSPVNPHVAIDMKLLEMYRLLCLEGHISLQAFCSSIQLLNEGNSVQVHI